MATHSSVLAWRIPGMGEPGGLPSMGSHRVRHDWGDLAAAATYAYNNCEFTCLNIFIILNTLQFLLLMMLKLIHHWLLEASSWSQSSFDIIPVIFFKLLLVEGSVWVGGMWGRAGGVAVAILSSLQDPSSLTWNWTGAQQWGPTTGLPRTP